MKDELGLITKKLIGFVFPSAECPDDFFKRASARKFKSSCFKGLGFLVVSNFSNLLDIQALEPFLIKVRLSCNQYISIIWELEGAARALFGLVVKVP